MESKWTIYSKPNGKCPHCENAKKFFKDNNINAQINIDQDKDKKQTFISLSDKIGDHKTFPIIFKGNEFIGGYGDLQKYIKENPNILDNKKKSVQTPYNMKIINFLESSFGNVCILPKHEQTNTLIPEEYWASIKNCANLKRFTLFPFQILCNGKYHQNFMIYDSDEKSLERFDPYKLEVVCSKNTIKKIDNQILKLFKTKLGNNFIEKYYTPIHKCSKNEHSKEDLCVYLYAYERLYDPDTDRNNIIIEDEELENFTQDYNDF